MDTEFLRQELNMLAILLTEQYPIPNQDLVWCYQYSDELYAQLEGIDLFVNDETDSL